MRIATLCLGFILAGCSFESARQTVHLHMAFPPPQLVSVKARVVRPLNEMGYSITVRGNELQPTYPTSALAGRLPECLALGGRVSSFHTYEALIADGVDLTLDSGTWTISVNGYFPKPTGTFTEAIANESEIYLIGSVVVDTATTSQASLSAATYLGQSSPEELFSKCRDTVYSVQALSAPSTGRCKNTGSLPAKMWVQVISSAASCQTASEGWSIQPVTVAPNDHGDQFCPNNGFYKVCCISGHVSAVGGIPANFPPNSSVESTICGL